MNKELLFQIYKPITDREEKEQLKRDQEAEAKSILLPYVPKIVGAMMYLPKEADWHWSINLYSWDSWRHKKQLCCPAVITVGKLDFIVEGIQSWRDLTSTFEILNYADINSSDWVSTDDAESYSRIYKTPIKSADDRITLGISITASLPGDTDECRRVITGYTDPSGRSYESEEPKPIYKLECK